MKADHSSLPMFAFDLHTREIADANDAATHAYCYSREELIGLLADALCSTKTMAAILATVETTPAHETVWLGPLQWKRRDGSTFEADTAVLRSSDGVDELFVLIADSAPGSLKT